MKHTEEPWIAQGQTVYSTHKGYARHAIAILPDVCEPAHWMDQDYEGPIEYGGAQHEETQRANAARIVACVNACKGINPKAVPDLLASLEKCVAVIGDLLRNQSDDPDDREAYDAARAAIAKAEERT